MGTQKPVTDWRKPKRKTREDLEGCNPKRIAHVLTDEDTGYYTIKILDRDVTCPQCKKYVFNPKECKDMSSLKPTVFKSIPMYVCTICAKRTVVIHDPLIDSKYEK